MAHPPSLGTSCEIRGRSRHDRFTLQGVARSALAGQKSPKAKAYRLVNCMRAIGKEADGVSILKGPDGRAKFGGLQTCGSVWTCPICSAKIVRHREGEIKKALDAHLAGGGFALMITLTHRHDRQDQVADLVDRYGRAVRWMKALRAYKALLAGVGYVGSIRALEVTFGDRSGWHPHGHELHFIGKELTDREIRLFRAALFALWLEACIKHGLPPPSEAHGVDVVRAVSAAQYIAKASSDSKWTVAKELTHAHSKQTRSSERFTPFDLLRAIQIGHRPGQMTVLFREYAAAYHGRRQLHWSAGLKAMFGINDVSDEDVMDAVEAQHEKAGMITKTDWRERVLRHRLDLRPVILALYEVQGMDAVRSFIASLPWPGRSGSAGAGGAPPSPIEAARRVDEDELMPARSPYIFDAPKGCWMR